MKQTKVISIFTQKGGTGKTDTTLYTANEIILQEWLINKRKVSVLIIDADNQQSLIKRRAQDTSVVENKVVLSPQNKDIIKTLEKRVIFLNVIYGFLSCEILSVNSEKGERNAVNEIASGKYDYVFIDMPGTLAQENTALLYDEIQYLYIPLSYSVNDINSTLDFYSQIQELKPINIKKIEFVFNRYNKTKARAFNTISDIIKAETSKDVDIYIDEAKKIFDDGNSFLPISVKINLVTNEIQRGFSPVQNLVLDIIKNAK